MKKALIYISIILVAAFVGLTTYYLVRNDEIIRMKIPESSIVYLNAEDSYDFPLEHIKPHNKTTVEWASSNNDIVAVDVANKKLIAQNVGGQATITISTNNKDFGTKTFTIHVSDGSSEYPFYISTATQLASIGKKNGTQDLIPGWGMSANYKLLNDIDLSTVNGGEWSPIGSLNGATDVFSGSFNGSMNVISNLKIKTDKVYAGLFGIADSDSEIQNIILRGVDINGAFSYAGGVVGKTAGNVKKCYVDAVVGKASSIINTKDNPAYTGGIVGMSERSGFTRKTIELCSATLGSLSGKGFVGGIAGRLGATTVFNCVADIVFGVDETDNMGTIGGIAGVIDSMQKTENSNTFERESIVKHCFAAILNNGTAMQFGGIVGEMSTDALLGERQANQVVGCFYGAAFSDDVLAVAAASPNSIEEGQVVVSKLSAQQYSVATSFIYADNIKWNFDNVWEINRDRPVISVDSTSESLGIFETGSIIDVGFLTTLAGTEAARSYNYTINEEVVIDCMTDEGKGELPYIEEFTGSITPKTSDAKLIIKNFKITDGSKQFIGLFGKLVGAEVSSITFKDFDINIAAGSFVPTSADGVNVGILCGVAENSTISNISFQGDTTSAKYSVTAADLTKAGQEKEAMSNFGFLAGTLNGSSVNTIYTDGINLVVNGYNASVGGLIGKSKDSTIGGQYLNNNEDVITSQNYVKTASPNRLFIGGVVGTAENTIIYGVQKTAGEVIGTASEFVYVGGIVGSATDKTVISHCFIHANPIKSSGASVSSYVGGLVGKLEIDAIISYCSATEGVATGERAGGVAAVSYGTIDKCYTTIGVTGSEIGGIAYLIKGKTENTYTACNLILVASSSNAVEETASGFATYLQDRNLGVIKYCFSSCSFSGSIDKKSAITLYFPETSNNTRNYITTPISDAFDNWEMLGASQGKIEYSSYNATKISYGFGSVKGEKWVSKITNKASQWLGEKILNNGVKTWTKDNESIRLHYVTFTEDGKPTDEAITSLRSLGFSDAVWQLHESIVPVLTDVPMMVVPVAPDEGVVEEGEGMPEIEEPEIG